MTGSTAKADDTAPPSLQREGPSLAPMNPTPAQQLIAVASGARVSQMIHGAAELGLADQLASGAREVEELAAACGADPDSLVRLLRGLASLGVFEETAPRRFALTPMAALLRGDHPGSLRQFVRRLGEEQPQSWDDQLHCVRNGARAFRHRHGCSVFEWSRVRPAAAPGGGRRKRFPPSLSVSIGSSQVPT